MNPDRLLFIACDTHREVGPVIRDGEFAELAGERDLSPGLVWFSEDKAEWFVLDGTGHAWEDWHQWARVHGGETCDLVVLDRHARVAKVQRTDWRPRMVHGPWPYELNTDGQVDHVHCQAPGCGQVHTLGRRVPGPGRMAQRVVCPHCGSEDTQWYWAERYGPWVHCRGCGNPHGPGSDQHWARESLRLAPTGESPTRATLAEASIVVPDSGTLGG